MRISIKYIKLWIIVSLNFLSGCMSTPSIPDGAKVAAVAVVLTQFIAGESHTVNYVSIDPDDESYRLLESSLGVRFETSSLIENNNRLFSHEGIPARSIKIKIISINQGFAAVELSWVSNAESSGVIRYWLESNSGEWEVVRKKIVRIS